MAVAENMLRTSVIWLFAAASLTTGRPDYFTPTHRLTALGVARSELTPELLNERTRLMVESQTFYFLREPAAVPGAERVEKLSKVFEDAGRQSGIRPSLLKAIAYLESFGDPNAQSPAGPKGIMQVASGTARDMGLRMIYSTQYRTVIERKQVKNKRGRFVWKTVTAKVPFQVLLRDERLIPERAIPAAANFLARLEKLFGGLDWAVFAYHCGVGCVANMQALTERARGIDKPITVPKMFFLSSPVLNRELYLEIAKQMERDWSPTYYFRALRAEQLLQLYREDPDTFRELADYYRYEPDPAQRAQHRLAVWLKSSDIKYLSCDDIKRDDGKRLARVFDNPEYFGFRINKDALPVTNLADREYYLQATPAAIGTLTYIAFETHRLFDAMRSHGDRFVPLEVTSLVRSMDHVHDATPGEALAHCSGQVFDLRYDSLPPTEREALQFVLDDMGYEGYLGFIDETTNSGTMHIGCSPSSRDFFAGIFQESLAVARR